MNDTVMRILVITEGKLRTDRSLDGIGAMLDAVVGWRSSLGSDLFSIKRVQINDDKGFDLKGAIEKDNYDQIWLFGSGSPTDTRVASRPLEDHELKALRVFMDAGGGVFATGDHEDVGASLCAKIPRVRHMRSWGVGGFTPAKSDGSRADTVFSSRFVDRDWDTEQDAVGKPIWVKYTDEQPHHLLQGYTPPPPPERPPGPLNPAPPSIIRWLPDHMHEGECRILPGGFDAQVRADFKEGAQTEIVAWSMKRGFSDVMGVKEDKPSLHNVVCCYDGHPDKVGRVVVDSTFHHWTEENTAAIRASAVGQDLDCYPVNIALWLSKAMNDGSKRMAMVRALGQQKEVVSVLEQKSHMQKLHMSTESLTEELTEELTEQQYNLLLGQTAEAVWAANGMSVLVLRETLEKIRAAKKSSALPGGTGTAATEAAIDGQMATKKDLPAAVEPAAASSAVPIPESAEGLAIDPPLSVPAVEAPADGGEPAGIVPEESIAAEMPPAPAPVVPDENQEGANMATAWERTGKLLDSFLESNNGPADPE